VAPPISGPKKSNQEKNQINIEASWIISLLTMILVEYFDLILN
jgi:hypothetical protein